jgi:hypothetical protein
MTWPLESGRVVAVKGQAGGEWETTGSLLSSPVRVATDPKFVGGGIVWLEPDGYGRPGALRGARFGGVEGYAARSLVGGKPATLRVPAYLPERRGGFCVRIDVAVADRARRRAYRRPCTWGCSSISILRGWTSLGGNGGRLKQSPHVLLQQRRGDA